MKQLFILSFLVVYAFFGLELGYTAESAWWTHLTYSFQHASVGHLVLNSVSFYILFNILRILYPAPIIISISFAAAFTVSWLCIYDKPVVGASGLVYAMLGMYFYLLAAGIFVFRNKTWLFTFAACTVLSLILGFVKENSAGLLHLLCLIAGFIGVMILQLTDKKRHGQDRYNRQ